MRALLVALVAGFIGEPSLPASRPALASMRPCVATLLDGVDGWLARRTGMASAFGARFDMEIDALLIQVLADPGVAVRQGRPWVLLSGLLRYIFVAAGWVLPWMRAPLFPSRRRKAICVVQIAGLILAHPAADRAAGQRRGWPRCRWRRSSIRFSSTRSGCGDVRQHLPHRLEAR